MRERRSQVLVEPLTSEVKQSVLTVFERSDVRHTPGRYCAAVEIVSLVSVTERPHLVEAFAGMDALWPPFMLQDPCARWLHALSHRFSATYLCILDADGRLLGRIIAVPVPWAIDQRLPDRGWDAAIEAAVEAYIMDTPTKSLALLELTLTQEARGRGVARESLGCLRSWAAANGFDGIVAPVRPITKAERSGDTIDEFLDDVLSARWSDPWVELHLSLGGRICGIAHRSMVVVGTLEQWQAWTKTDTSATSVPGQIDGALVPVIWDDVTAMGIYIEPNIWFKHLVKSLPETDR